MADRKQEVTPRLREIDLREIEQLEVIGRGSFGTVYKALWQNNYVAVKYFEQESERNAFAIEVRQLSRVAHPNIVGLYGACTGGPHVCLVMEYAEGGSLYNVLHCKPKPFFTAAHAMSWARQCAEGVAYLHAMQPKALIHRDLKPPNLLLVDEGRTLKICDFGTVADKSTLMTNNKGSAAWMAPEVFEGSTYTEKCDVFSWGIILWEVLSREQPFKDIGLTYSIMWRVHKGHRPPLIEGCPKPIENLMTSCWDPKPSNRPSMAHVVNIMTELCKFFPGADEPLVYDIVEEVDIENDDTLDSTQSYYEHWEESSLTTPTNSNELSQHTQIPNRENIQSSIDSKQQSGQILSQAYRWGTIPEEKEEKVKQARWATSNENEIPKIVSTGSSEYIRNGMLKSHDYTLQPLSVEVDPNAWELSDLQKIIHGVPKSQGKERLTVTETQTTSLPEDHPSTSVTTADDLDNNSDSSLDLDTMHLMLDPELQPETPDPNSRLSQEIFQEHKDLAKEYLKVETEIAYVTKHKEELLASMDPIERQKRLDIWQKLVEKESLLGLQSCLKKQLEAIQAAQKSNTTEQVSRQDNNNQTQQSAPTNQAENDGWVYIP